MSTSLHDAIPNLGAKCSGSSDSPVNQSSAANKKDRYIAGMLVLCLLLVGFWEVMSSRSERPWAAFQLEASDFERFSFECDGWSVVKRDVSPSPIEPEILKYDLMRSTRTGYGFSVRARLIHGYNMVDCMRIKGYTVTLLHDSSSPSFPVRQSLPDLPICENSRSPSSSAFIGGYNFSGRIQIWELENSVGDKSIWVTSMLRAGDFAVLDVSTTDMAFPRVGVPDNPDWLPTGVGWKSFRHPVRNFKLMMRSKWNGARCDPMVFLKLKQPPWADEEVLTLVSNSGGQGTGGGEQWVEVVLEAHGKLYGKLLEWRRKTAE